MKHRPNDNTCPCDSCAVDRRIAVWRYRRSHSFETGEPLVINQPHGTRARYKRGCRCQPCTDEANAYRRAMTARRADR